MLDPIPLLAPDCPVDVPPTVPVVPGFIGLPEELPVLGVVPEVPLMPLELDPAADPEPPPELPPLPPDWARATLVLTAKAAAIVQTATLLECISFSTLS